MIRNILNRILSSEVSAPSTTEPVSTADNSSPQPLGISAVHDSFESVPSKYSSGFDPGLMPSKQDLDDATKNQEQLLKEKQNLRDEEKRFEEITANNGGDYTANNSVDYQANDSSDYTVNNGGTYSANNSFDYPANNSGDPADNTDPMKSAQSIANNLASTSDDPLK